MLALAGCGGSSQKTGHLHGTVMRGPTSPVCRPTAPCMEPANGAMLTFDSVGSYQTITIGGVPGKVGAGSALVRKNGTYSVSLPPGTYDVNWVYIGSVPSNVGRGIDPRMVEVSPGENGRVDFVIDTGIR